MAWTWYTNGQQKVTPVSYTNNAARAKTAVAQSFTNNVPTVVTFELEDYDYGGLHSTVTNNSRLTAQESGVYLIEGSVCWTANTSGDRGATLRVNGTTLISSTTNVTNATVGLTNRHTISAHYYLTAGQYVELLAYQNSGGSLTLDSTTPTSFSMALVSPPISSGGGGAGALTDLTDVDVSAAVDGSLFRYDTGVSQWQATTASNLLLDDNGQMQLPAVGSTGGLLIGGDTNLYRSAADVLTTDDSLVVTGDLSIGGGDIIATGAALIFSTSSTLQTFRLVQATSFSDSLTTSFAQIGDATNKNAIISGAAAAILDRLAISAAGIVFSDDAHTSIQPPVTLLNLEGTGLSEGLTFGSDQASPVSIYHSAANTIALDTNDKIQQSTLPTAADDLTNQVWVERMDIFYA